MVAYQTAYLKAHYPLEFMTALLTQDMGNQDKTIKNIAECREMGIEILPPDINESQADFTIVEEKIRFGLAAVKNVGLKAVKAIIEEREIRGPFKDIIDFCSRIDHSKVNKKVIEGLIQCGAFDFTGVSRARLFNALDEIMRVCTSDHRANQLSIFGGQNLTMQSVKGITIPETEEWDEKEKLRREKEAMGFYITGHPLEEYRLEVKRNCSCQIQDLHELQDKSSVKIAGVVEGVKIKRTKKGDKMANIVLEDMTGSIEVIIFPDLFNRVFRILKSEEPVIVKGTIEANETSMKLIAQDIALLEKIREQEIKAIEICLKEGSITKKLLMNLRQILFKYPGNCQVRFRIELSNSEKEVLIVAHNSYNISPCQELVDDIQAVLGAGSFRFVYE